MIGRQAEILAVQLHLGQSTAGATLQSVLGGYVSLESVFRENSRCRETVLRAIVEKVFLPWDLRLGPAVRTDFYDPSGTDRFDNLVGLEIDLNATAA